MDTRVIADNDPTVNRDIPLSPRLVAALDYASRGIAVFPCRAGTKEPLGRSHGFKDRTTDPDVIRAWFAVADYNVAIVPADAGLTLLDPDGEEGKAAAKELGCDPKATRTVKTPHGYHLYYLGVSPRKIRIKPGLDVLSSNGYALVPPSIVDGLEYKVINDVDPIAMPATVSGLLEAREHQRVNAPLNYQADLPDNISRAATWLKGQAVPVEGQGSDDATYQLAQRLLDVGLSPATATDMLVDFTGFDDDWVEEKVDNALRYGQNEPGCYALDGRAPEVKFRAYLHRWRAEHPEWCEDGCAVDPAIAERMKRFRTVLPSEAMRRAPPTFYDKDKLFLRAPGGSSTIIFAAYSNFKTTFSCGRSLAIAKEHDARVLYVVCEGVDGFGPLTLQAAVKDWTASHAGDPITDEWLDAHLRMEETPPRLTDPLDMAALAEKYREFAPNMTFIDTLGAAAAGLNLSAIEVGTAIGVNFRAFVRDLKTDGVLVHHEGKDEERGAIGSIYLTNDTDSELRLRHDPDQEVLAVIVEKSRWGERFRTVNFGTRKVPGLQVEGWEQPAEFVAVYELRNGDPKRNIKVARNSAQAKAQRTAQEELVFIQHTLRDHGARDAASGVKGIDLALMLAGDREEEENDKQYDQRIRAWARKLKNKASRDPGYRRLFALVTEDEPPHREVRRWFAPLPEPDAPGQVESNPW